MEWDFTPGEFAWRLALFLGIIAVNAFFVISEFAMVKVRSSQLQEHKRRGAGSAALALKMTAGLEQYLSATQLGITLMSIACGAVGEPLVAMVIEPLLYKVGVTSHAAIHILSTVLSFAAVTFPVVVLGEQLPKRMALRNTVAVCLWVARPLEVIYRVLKPFTLLLNASTNVMLRALFRIDPNEAGSTAASGEEIRHIVAESEKSQQVTATERDILVNALTLNELRVRDIMTPRNQVVCLDIEEPFAAMVDHAVRHKHTRYPLVEGHLDHPMGVIHIKDLLRVVHAGGKDLRQAMKPALTVPEMWPIDRLLNHFLQKHAHFALVLDEFGGTVGAVTFDNVVEEIVGDIQDEFDDDKPEFEKVSKDVFLVDGMLNLYELKDHLGLELESDDVTTVGGYVTSALGHLPKAGETTLVGGYKLTVLKAGQRRVQQVRLERLEPTPAESDESDTETERHS
jgi:CBS domain containing-hemolysin-like protein